MLDNKLNFKSHMKHVRNKISKKIGYLKRVGGRLSMWTKVMIYNTIIKPHFEYCSSIMLNISREELKALQTLQNKVMRYILQEVWYTSQLDLLNKLEWNSVKETIDISTLTFIHKIKLGSMPSYLDQVIQQRNDGGHEYNTRNKMDIYLKQCNSNLVSNSLAYGGVREYNKLPEELKVKKDLSKFKLCVTKIVRELR